MTDTVQMDVLVQMLEATGDYRILRRVPSVTRYAEPAPDVALRRGVIVDVETTGLDPTRDKIIELAILPFDFSSEGALFDVHEGYAGFEDPGEPLSAQVVQLTGITDADVRGQQLNDALIAELAAKANLVIAHNARFDRRFAERRLPMFVDKAWACSLEQVPWAEEGLRARALDYLLFRFGYFFDEHRALNDCRALLHLLSLDLPLTGRPILPLFLETARRPSWRIWALGAAFELKDRLKERGYRWSGGEDGRPKAWFRDVEDVGLSAEELFLANEIYDGTPRHETVRIDFRNRFSDRE